MENYSKKRFRILIIAVFLGLVLGCAIATLASRGVFKRWQSLDAPPGGAVEILDATGPTVYVRAANEVVYLCERELELYKLGFISFTDNEVVRSFQRFLSNPFNDDLEPSCWQETEWPVSLIRSGRRIIDETQFWSLFPPTVDPVNRLIVRHHPGDEMTVETKYLVLNDGSVWWWEHGEYWNGFMWNGNYYLVIVPFLSIIGIAAGFILAVGKTKVGSHLIENSPEA